MKVKYYNITYKCNSSCLFCAANIGLIQRDECDLQLNDFIKSTNEADLEPGDRIILNGGEPTLCSDFQKIIEFCESKGFIIDIYSNGKLFYNSNFCNSVFKSGKYYIRIPLFGLNELHDYLTGKVGNFTLTIEGVKNLIKTQAYKDRRLTIEIKLLLAKCCVEENVEVIKYLYNNGILNKVSLSLNPLLISRKVLNNSALFVDTYSKMLNNSKELFIKAKEYGVIISTDLLPYCVIPQAFFEKELINASKYNNAVQIEYNDSSVKNNSKVIKNNHTGNELCDKCKYRNICPKFPLSYLEHFGSSEINPQ